MANVKISDLPTIGNFSLNNVVVVNDTVTNTTCKGTLSQTLRKLGHVRFAPLSGMTLTVDGSSSDTLNITHVITAAGLGTFATRSNVTFTNNTSEYVRLELTAQNSTNIYAYNNVYIPIPVVNHLSLKNSTGGQLKAPFFLVPTLNNQNISILNVKGTAENGDMMNAYVAPNSAWNASYTNWFGIFIVGNALNIDE